MNSKQHAEQLRHLAAESGLIALYHGVWPTPPEFLAKGVHNVDPECLGQHLEQLRQHFEIVSVDEFCAARDPRGLAAISFDDGYRCIAEHGLPVFEALDVPFTVYVNGSSFRGKVFWRDKVRFLDQAGLVNEFEAFARDIDTTAGKRFYRYTKNPVNSSAYVDQEIDRFLVMRNLADSLHRKLRFCVLTIDELFDHPLVSWGNHSESHYVMSSLDTSTVAHEVSRTRQILESRRDITLSEYFSIPFGEMTDFDDRTVHAVREAGYRGLLLSRARAHRGPLRIAGMSAFERFMPRTERLLANL